MSGVLPNDLERDLWNEQVAWSQTADRLHDVRSRSRVAVLSLTIAGVVLQTIAATGPKALQPGIAIAGTIVLAVSAALAGFLLKPEVTRRWLRARSVSEGIKSEFYAYRASASPYTGADALRCLKEKVSEIKGFAKDIVTERARTIVKPKPIPEPLSEADYLEKRIQNQIDNYYVPNAKLNADRAEAFRKIEIVLAIVAAVLSAIASSRYVTHDSAVPPLLGAWVAVVTTIAGSIAAYAAASRYDFQATTFYATAQELRDLKGDWLLSKGASNADWSGFVRKCENVISAENRAWMAKLLQDH